MKKTNYRSIFISDIHLGAKNSKAAEAAAFLKQHNCEYLYLVGDILDGWKVQANRWKWNTDHMNVIRQIMTKAKKDTKVIYITGNHDEFLRPLLRHNLAFGNITIKNRITHVSVDGRKYLVLHGDLFDGINRIAPWISFLGDRAYDILLSFNSKFNWLRRRFGFGYWSLSGYLKQHVKGAMNFIYEFEKNLISYAERKGFNGVICGHVHKPEIRQFENTILYMNDGDFVESISALVETYEGDWIVLMLIGGYWTPIYAIKANSNEIISGDNCCPDIIQPYKIEIKK